FIINNASNNDIIIRHVGINLCESFSILYNPIFYRLRYTSYILNLVAKSFLFVTNDETLEV
ncbi:hypothetical protein BKA61DRAFT_450594, partial [Leptodontidium sp. MPI-SDFR-AT-0119]